ncbi:MAG: hypothetical protein ABI369_02845 [Acetobacteraceae bacterium]
MGKDGDDTNVLRFPVERRARPNVALLAEWAPSRSWVDTLLAERGVAPHDVWGGFAHEFAYQARALEAGEGRDAAIVRLRGLVDAHVGHAAELCQRYRETADALVTMEVRMARGERMAPGERRRLNAARTDLRGWAIAARVAADAALGAATALGTYIRDGLAGLPDGSVVPEQLTLFSALAG